MCFKSVVYPGSNSNVDWSCLEFLLIKKPNPHVLQVFRKHRERSSITSSGQGGLNQNDDNDAAFRGLGGLGLKGTGRVKLMSAKIDAKTYPNIAADIVLILH